MHYVRDGRAITPVLLALVLTASLSGASCSYNDDHLFCGNGVLEIDRGETCDNGIPAGQPGACLIECDDGDTCTDDAIASGTRQTCTQVCTHTLDSNCITATCGNGKLDSGEACDTAIVSGEGACPESCDDALPCTGDTLAGVGCAARCEHADITTTSGQTADGCCPAGVGNSGNDIDCPASCGNGVVDLGETCDRGIVAGDGACPTLASCNDHIGCTIDSVSGGSCTQRCQHQLITTPSGASSDQCCPGGGNHNSDIDCPIICGNGAVESGERCDVGIHAGLTGHCPGAAECDDVDACTDDSLVAGGTCGAHCEHAPRGVSGANEDGCCPSIGSFNTDADCPAVCGNGVLEAGAGEACDSAIPVGMAGHCPGSAGECNDTNSCTTDGLSGSGCARTCTHAQVTRCQLTDDGCCPAGCNANDDGDCSPSCGNGTVEGPPAGNETCDTSIATGAPGACPTLADCNDNVACTADSLAGSGCNMACVHAPIVDPSGTRRDGCCPSGANSTTDVDCPVVCGNSVIEAGETCDTGFAHGQPGACPTLADCKDSDACTSDGVSHPGTCQAVCDAHTPIVPCCGNGTVETGETCDTAIPKNMTGACPSSCDDANACTTDTASGSACTFACSHVAFTPCCGDGIVTDTGMLEETCDTAIPAAMPGSCDRISCRDDIPCTSDAAVDSGGNACKKICPHSAINDPGGVGVADGCCPPQSRLGQDADCRCGNGVKDTSSFEQCDDQNAANADMCTNSCTLGGGMAVGSPCTMDSDCSALGAGATCLLPGTLPPATTGMVNGYCSKQPCDPATTDTNGNGVPQNLETCPQLLPGMDGFMNPNAQCVRPAGATANLCLALCDTVHGENDCRRTESGPAPGGWAYHCTPLMPPSTTGVCLPRDPRAPSLPVFP